MSLEAAHAIQPADELDRFYEKPDPWGYDAHPDDAMRTEMVLAHVPEVPYQRILDIGCGNGFLTAKLPGKKIVGVDISERALGWARKRCRGARYSFARAGVLELDAARLGTFDLVVMTGVAYPQYIGSALALLQLRLDSVLKPGGWLLHVHITDWFKGGFPYALIDRHLYPYRDRWHLLETYIK